MSISIPFHGNVENRPLPRARRVLRTVVAGLLLFLTCFTLGWTAWATVEWLKYGRVVARPPEDPIMSRFMPRYEVVEHHERIVAAPPAVVFRAVQSFRLEDSPVIRAIFSAREIILTQRSIQPLSPPPFLQLARQIGWGILDSIRDREVAFGAITQPWRGDVHFRPLTPERFPAFDSAGYAKIAWSIGVDSLGPARSRLRTETRVMTTDPVSRAKFRRYWSIYSPGIVLIRREALRLIGRAAEDESTRP